MPVVLAGFKKDAVAGADDLDWAALTLTETDALRDVDGLPRGWVCHAVRALGVKCTLAAPRREGFEPAAIMSM